MTSTLPAPAEVGPLTIGTATYTGRHRAQGRVLDTRAMPNGTERPGEHWNARLIREAAEQRTGTPGYQPRHAAPEPSTVDRKAATR